MQVLIQNLSYALRQLRRAPGFALTAIATLALTVGLAATVFSVFDAILLRPLPYGEPDRIVVLYPHSPSGYSQPASTAEYRFWRTENRCFAELAGFSVQTMNLSNANGPAAIHAVHSTANLFAVVKVKPMLGRTFLPGEDLNGHNDVVVLSYSLWRKNFGGQSGVLGAKVDLDGRPMTVIGVLPPSFRFPLQQSDGAYAPFRWSADDLSSESHRLRTWGRLKPGVSASAAEAEMTRVLAAYARVRPASQGRRMHLETLPSALVGQTSSLLHVLVLAVFAVLALGCVNIAGLMLVRGLRRERELSLRAAIGATRSRLAAQLIAEIILLAVAGTAAGGMIAWALLTAVRTLLQASLERGSGIALNAPVVCASLFVALLTLLLAGLLPLRQLFSVAPAHALRSGGAATGASRTQHKLGSLFIALQMALAMVLLVTSGLLLRSLATLRGTDLGFQADHLLVEDVNLTPGVIVGRDIVRTFYQPLLDQVRALPGVQSAAVINMLPVQDWGSNSEVQIVGKPPAPKNQERLAEQRSVSPAYYRTMGTRLLQGRLFDPSQDTQHSRLVAVVNQAFVKKFFEPGEDPVGRKVNAGGEDISVIIGVVSNQRQNLYQPPLAEIDESIDQIPAKYMGYVQELQLVVRTSVNPLSLAEPLRHAMQSLDPGLPFRPALTMEQIVGDVLVLERLENLLFGVFAALAVLLASLGLYGLIAQRVEQGRRDIGVRMALGARRGQVLLELLRRVAVISLAGLAAGLVLSYALRRVIGSVLSVHAPHELLFVGMLALGMAVLALLASAAPALRAASVDPVEVLRAE